MDCTIKFTKEGKIKNVFTPQGVESKLFQQIAKLPHVNNLEEALEIFKNIYSKKLNTYYNLIGEKGAQKRPILLSKLDEAKKLELEGKTFSQTGWFKENNQWKFLDVDILKNFRLNEGKTHILGSQKLGDVLDNKLLFETFPFLTDMEILFEDASLLSTAGFNPKSKTIRIGTKPLTEEQKTNRLSIITSSVIHELQHSIQYFEGFPTGGGGNTVIMQAIREMGEDEITDPLVFISKANKYLKNNTNSVVKAVLDVMISYTESEDKNEFKTLYKRLFGEVEARLMQDLRDKLLKGESFEGISYADLKSDMLRREGLEGQELFTVYAEPTLNFKSNLENTFQTFKEALLDSTGGEIEISIGEFPVMTVSSNTNINEVGGFINNNIKAGILSDERIIENGESFLKAEGYAQARQIVNELYIKEDALYNIGAGSVKIHKDGRIQLNERVKPTETPLNNALRDALNKKTATQKPLSEDKLKLKLLDLLNKMGVKVLSISDYIEKYKIRNGVDPSAEALADIANQVIAFKDGQIPVELLSEETCHFIVEAWEETEIENLLRNIHKTDTYVEISQEYREIYTRENPSMSAEEIETLVRKEVLGKELAKALQSQFSSEGKTDIQKSILQKILEMFTKFIQNIAGMTNQNEKFYNDLENLTSKVEEMLLEQDVDNYLNLERLKTKKFKLYSIAKAGNVEIDSIRDLARKTVAGLLEQEKALRRAKKGSQASVQALKDIDKKLEDIAGEMDEALLAKSVAEVLSLAHRQTRYISDAITSADKKGETLSNEEAIVFHNLRDVTQVMLARMADLIKDNKNLKNLIPTIEKVNTNITSLKGKLDNTENDILDRIIDRLMKRHNLPETTYNDDGTVKRDVRQELRDSLETAKKDTNMLFAMYGQITHARDPLLNMLGSVISDIFTTAEQNHVGRAKTLQDSIVKAGFKIKDAKDFIKGKWMLSLWDWNAFEESEREIKATVLKEISQTTKTVEELKDRDVFLEVLQGLTAEQNSEYQSKSASRLREERENPFNDDYYDKREQKLKDLGISQPTISALRLLSVSRGEIVGGATMENGRPRFTLQNKYELDALNLKRRSMKSLFDFDGNLKAGVVVDENGAVEVGGVRYSLLNTASEDATIAFEINKIDADFIETQKAEGKLNTATGFSEDFLKELETIEDESEAREFFLMNTNISFSDEFWDGFDGQNSFINRAEAFATGKPEAEKKLEQYKEVLQKRNAILKLYRDTRNTTNTLAEEMTDDIRERVVSLSDTVDELAAYFSAFKDFPKGDEIEAESTPNEAYFGALADKNRETDKEKLEYAMRHMTSSNLRKVRELNDAFSDLEKRRVLTSRQETIIERATGSNAYDINLNDIAKLKLTYAEGKLASYYRAFAPQGLSQLMRELESGEKSAFEVAQEINNNPDIKATNHFSYYEKSEVEGKNENRISNFAGGHVQPKLYDKNGNATKYINKEFVEMFAPKTENGKIIFDENGEITPTKNQQKYEFYKMLMKYHQDSLKSYGEYGTHNAFLAPQIDTQGFEKINDFVKKRDKSGTIKEWWRSISQYRVDELETGEQINGESIYRTTGTRVIPKYYMHTLEEGKTISQDLFYTLTAFAQQSELYKSRVENFHEISTLETAMLRKGRYPEGKKAETTSTYKIFQNYMNGAIFGIRETRDARVNLPIFGEVNLIKVIDSLHKFLQNRALAWNVIIPATSWLTAEATLLMEKYIGQYIDKDSYKRANAELRKLATPAIKESMTLDSKAKLSVMGEYFGVFDLDARFKNSIYNTQTRLLGRSGYIMHTMGNFTPISKALLSGLFGHRIYGDQIVDFNQFKAIKLKSGAPLKTIKADWVALENKSVYNYIGIDEATNTMTYNYDQIAKDMGTVNDEAFRENFRNKELALTAKLRKLVELIDGNIRQEERTLLQRDAIGRFTMTHSSWLAIAAARRLKARHYSMQTGIEEEGTYVSLGKFLTRAFNGIRKDNIKAFKKAYLEADDVEKANLMRILKEAAFLQGMFLVGLGLGAFADDDDNQDIYALQASSYLMDRVVNETSSSQFGVMGEFYGKMKEPIVGLKNLKDLLTVKSIFDFSEVERGSYQGMTHSGQYFIKNVPGLKNFRDLKNSENLKSARDNYDFFATQEDWTIASYFIDEENLE